MMTTRSTAECVQVSSGWFELNETQDINEYFEDKGLVVILDFYAEYSLY